MSMYTMIQMFQAYFIINKVIASLILNFRLLWNDKKQNHLDVLAKDWLYINDHSFGTEFYTGR